LSGLPVAPIGWQYPCIPLNWDAALARHGAVDSRGQAAAPDINRGIVATTVLSSEINCGIVPIVVLSRSRDRLDVHIRRLSKAGEEVVVFFGLLAFLCIDVLQSFSDENVCMTCTMVCVNVRSR
jgi:hypothetical protein